MGINDFSIAPQFDFNEVMLNSGLAGTVLNTVTITPSGFDHALDVLYAYSQLVEPELYANLQMKVATSNGKGKVTIPVAGVGASTTKGITTFGPESSYISYKASDLVEVRLYPAKGNNTPGEDAAFRALILAHPAARIKRGNFEGKVQLDINGKRDGETLLGARVVGEYFLIRGKSNVSVEINAGYRQKVGPVRLWTLLPGSGRR